MYKSKQGERKEYKVSFGDTDFSIPTFGYRSSIFILVGLFAIVFVVPMVIDNAFLAMVVGALLAGLTFAYSQYFLQSKKGFTKGFWITFALLSILIFFLLLVF